MRPRSEIRGAPSLPKCIAGRNRSGWSSEPAVIAIIFVLSRAEKTVVPHRPQKPRLRSGEDWKVLNRPFRVTSLPRKRSLALNAAPIAFWHMRQWQMRSLTGSPSATYLTAPQRHPPSYACIGSANLFDRATVSEAACLSRSG